MANFYLIVSLAVLSTAAIVQRKQLTDVHYTYNSPYSLVLTDFFTGPNLTYSISAPFTIQQRLVPQYSEKLPHTSNPQAVLSTMLVAGDPVIGISLESNYFTTWDLSSCSSPKRLTTNHVEGSSSIVATAMLSAADLVVVDQQTAAYALTIWDVADLAKPKFASGSRLSISAAGKVNGILVSDVDQLLYVYLDNGVIDSFEILYQEKRFNQATQYQASDFGLSQINIVGMFATNYGKWVLCDRLNGLLSVEFEPSLKLKQIQRNPLQEGDLFSCEMSRSALFAYTSSGIIQYSLPDLKVTSVTPQLGSESPWTIGNPQISVLAGLISAYFQTNETVSFRVYDSQGIVDLPVPSFLQELSSVPYALLSQDDGICAVFVTTNYLKTFKLLLSPILELPQMDSPGSLSAQLNVWNNEASVHVPVNCTGVDPASWELYNFRGVVKNDQFIQKPTLPLVLYETKTHFNLPLSNYISGQGLSYFVDVLTAPRHVHFDFHIEQPAVKAYTLTIDDIQKEAEKHFYIPFSGGSGEYFLVISETKAYVIRQVSEENSQVEATLICSRPDSQLLQGAIYTLSNSFAVLECKDSKGLYYDLYTHDTTAKLMTTYSHKGISSSNKILLACSNLVIMGVDSVHFIEFNPFAAKDPLSNLKTVDRVTLFTFGFDPIDMTFGISCDTVYVYDSYAGLYQFKRTTGEVASLFLRTFGKDTRQGVKLASNSEGLFAVAPQTNGDITVFQATVDQDKLVIHQTYPQLSGINYQSIAATETRLFLAEFKEKETVLYSWDTESFVFEALMPFVHLPQAQSIFIRWDLPVTVNVFNGNVLEQYQLESSVIDPPEDLVPPYHRLANQYAFLIFSSDPDVPFSHDTVRLRISAKNPLNSASASVTFDLHSAGNVLKVDEDYDSALLEDSHHVHSHFHTSVPLDAIMGNNVEYYGQLHSPPARINATSTCSSKASACVESKLSLLTADKRLIFDMVSMDRHVYFVEPVSLSKYSASSGHLQFISKVDSTAIIGSNVTCSQLFPLPSKNALALVCPVFQGEVEMYQRLSIIDADSFKLIASAEPIYDVRRLVSNKEGSRIYVFDGAQIAEYIYAAPTLKRNAVLRCLDWNVDFSVITEMFAVRDGELCLLLVQQVAWFQRDVDGEFFLSSVYDIPSPYSLSDRVYAMSGELSSDEQTLVVLTGNAGLLVLYLQSEQIVLGKVFSANLEPHLPSALKMGVSEERSLLAFTLIFDSGMQILVYDYSKSENNFVYATVASDTHDWTYFVSKSVLIPNKDSDTFTLVSAFIGSGGIEQFNRVDTCLLNLSPSVYYNPDKYSHKQALSLFVYNAASNETLGHIQYHSSGSENIGSKYWWVWLLLCLLVVGLAVGGFFWYKRWKRKRARTQRAEQSGLRLLEQEHFT